jgi:PAS domain S-box-containing protein
MPERPDPAREPDEALEAFGSVLLEPSLEAALAHGLRLIADVARAKGAALLLLGSRGTIDEIWHPNDAALQTSLRPHCHNLLNEVAQGDGHGREPVTRHTPEGLPIRVLPIAWRDRLLGVVCLNGTPAREADAPRRHGPIRTVLQLLAYRVATERDAHQWQSEKAHYERWLKLLDGQIRVLDRERQKFAAIVNQSDTYVFVADTGRTIRWANRAMSVLFPPQEATSWVGRSYMELWARLMGRPLDEGDPDCPIAQAFRTSEPAHRELRTVRQGSEGTLYVTTLPIRGPEGSAQEVLVIIQDLSNLEALREAVGRLRTVVSNAPIVLFAIDKDGVFTLSEGRGLEVLGLEPGQVVGQSAYRVYQDYPRVIENIQRALAGDEFTDGVEVNDRSFETRYTPLHGAHGEVVGLIGVATDVTEHKRLEDQLRHAQKMEAIGRLAGGVAHDFNNLLTAMMGYSELLTTRLHPDEPLRKYALEIQKSGARAGLLTRQLLAFSRKEVLAPQVLDLNSTVSEMEDLLRRLLGEDVNLTTVLSATPASVRADPGQIEQVILNLAVNARDAMPNGGDLVIEVRPADPEAQPAAPEAAGPPPDRVLLSVSDTGCGMAKEVLSRVFEPFFTTKEPGKGTGLGLSIVYGIVQRSGGEIRVDSRVGHGTTFTLLLPQVVRGEESSDRGLPVFTPWKGTETILLVEDEPAVRDLAREVLAINGYTVLTASNGFEALTVFEQHEGRVDLAVTDVVMPQMHGGELAQRLLEIQPGLKLLYISGYTEDAIVRHGVSVAGTAFLQKPFSLDALVRKVREVLGAPASRAA